MSASASLSALLFVFWFTCDFAMFISSNNFYNKDMDRNKDVATDKGIDTDTGMNKDTDNFNRYLTKNSAHLKRFQSLNGLWIIDVIKC